ncbi:hypothetical protein [Halomicrococcus sp. SG-WS-1]|uniref:hypothetical protein n=1 Tax=Halomicrococcus sp. SG-WS-1 TaxID=3439057 RepID=UPI003F7A8958
MSKSNHVADEYTQRWVETLKDQDTQYVPEKYQLGILADYLRNEGYEYATEKRVFSYPIDILAIKDEETVAIEMKSKNVGRGVEQAHRDASLVDHAYLAVWDEQISDSLIESVEELPIGLISVGERAEIVVESGDNPQQLCEKENIIELVINDVRDDTAVQESK